MKKILTVFLALFTLTSVGFSMDEDKGDAPKQPGFFTQLMRLLVEAEKAEDEEDPHGARAKLHLKHVLEVVTDQINAVEAEGVAEVTLEGEPSREEYPYFGPKGGYVTQKAFNEYQIKRLQPCMMSNISSKDKVLASMQFDLLPFVTNFGCTLR